MGGNRVSKGRWVWNLFLVWALTGIWHGANWTFLCWGLFYFVLLLVERLTGFTKKIGFLGHVYALGVIILGWVLFRSANIGAALAYIGMMFGVGSEGLYDQMASYYLYNGRTIWIAAILLSMPIVPMLQKKWKDTAIRNIGEPVLGVCIFLLSLLITISSTYNPFIYFNF